VSTASSIVRDCSGVAGEVLITMLTCRHALLALTTLMALAALSDAFLFPSGGGTFLRS